MTVSQNNFNCAQKLSIIDMTRSVSCFVCIDNDNDNDNTFIEHRYRLQIRIYI